ncbi:MAG: TlyA family RNA methyltransferase [Desulfobacterales bacterium]|jgi:23S rRNA (cytidine1920-2'-O)/16S rRNA (cytidine1409-2'-O)-methyltransferase|nr:TlyA family RNA methyltransferase [Desulfobacteraceae bacterium]MBT7087019.1 TlyA family RNA methyltransferase [Desulfobacterales bacterium]MBT7697095.1 TlyA family RNA methyltransferase [Desulfobacterales bacterium]
MSGTLKKRLDILVVERNLTESRQRARAMIMAGKVLVDNIPVDKPGTQIRIESEIKIKDGDIPYVSRGGLKLEKAINFFNIDVNGFVCMDVGASTGGFTDCLIQHGAECIYAVDVGYGQLAWKLRQDPRVVPLERTNIRHMPEDTLPVSVDLVTIDVSFISLKIVVPSVIKFMKKEASILALIKPQFEVGKGKVGKGGVVREPVLHDKVINDLSIFFQKNGLLCSQAIPSPILGPKGNKEFIVLISSIAS